MAHPQRVGDDGAGRADVGLGGGRHFQAGGGWIGGQPRQRAIHDLAAVLPVVDGLEADGQVDYAIVQAGVLISAVAVVMSNLAVDISYGWFDPRIRYA